MADTIMWSNSTFPIAMFGNWKKKIGPDKNTCIKMKVLPVDVPDWYM